MFGQGYCWWAGIGLLLLPATCHTAGIPLGTWCVCLLSLEWVHLWNPTESRLQPKHDFSETLPDLTASCSPQLSLCHTPLWVCSLLKLHLPVRSQIFLVLVPQFSWAPLPDSRLLEGWNYLYLKRVCPTHEILPGRQKALKEHVRSKQTEKSCIFWIPIMWGFG